MGGHGEDSFRQSVYDLAFASNALKVILGTKIDSRKKTLSGSFFVLIKLTREAAIVGIYPSGLC